jgi:hypothetical protein
MKRLLLLLTFAVGFLNSCQDEEQLSGTEAVQFSLAIAGDSDQSMTDFPDEFSGRVTMQSTGGKTIVTNVTFTRSGDNYFSNAVTLPSGKYHVKEIVSENEKVAGIALLQDFVISNSAQKTVTVGHAALQSKTPLLIAVYADEDGKMQLTNAKLSIYNEDGEYYEYDLSAKTNHIAFKGDPTQSYSIKIEKEGYETYLNTFVYNGLEKKRLEITLQQRVIEPGLAVTFQPSATYFSMWLQFTGKGTVVLDWGKGEPEVINFDVDPERETETAYRYRDQTYALSIPPARITGDIELLVGIAFESDVDALNVYYATNLQELSFNETDLPVLDLSLNHELRALGFNLTSIGLLTLPQDHAIKFLSITPGYDGWPSVAELDYIIDNIYANAVAGGRYDGYISLGGATVSEQAVADLTNLQNIYGWEIQY